MIKWLSPNRTGPGSNMIPNLLARFWREVRHVQRLATSIAVTCGDDPFVAGGCRRSCRRWASFYDYLRFQQSLSGAVMVATFSG